MQNLKTCIYTFSTLSYSWDVPCRIQLASTPTWSSPKERMGGWNQTLGAPELPPLNTKSHALFKIKPPNSWALLAAEGAGMKGTANTTLKTKVKTYQSRTGRKTLTLLLPIKNTTSQVSVWFHGETPNTSWCTTSHSVNSRETDCSSLAQEDTAPTWPRRTPADAQRPAKQIF